MLSVVQLIKTNFKVLQVEAIGRRNITVEQHGATLGKLCIRGPPYAALSIPPHSSPEGVVCGLLLNMGW